MDEKELKIQDLINNVRMLKPDQEWYGWEPIRSQLEDFPKDALLSPLLTALEDANPLVRRTAIDLFTKNRESRALDAFIKRLLQEPDSKLRSRLVNALEVIGDPRALDVLEYVAETDRSQGVWGSVNITAATAIQVIRERNRMGRRR